MSSSNYLQLAIDCRCYCCCCGTACIPAYVGAFNSNSTCSPITCNRVLPNDCTMDGYIVSERIQKNQENHYFIGAVAIIFLALLVLWVSSSLKTLNRNLYTEAYRSRYIQLTRMSRQDDDEPLPPYEGPKDEEVPSEVIFSILGDAEEEEDEQLHSAGRDRRAGALQSTQDDEIHESPNNHANTTGSA
ncbi:hypothetical protein SeMB42_g05394 [Synchytrium endobioticum]|uniref:Uncharacterized protein n=1 Tax=Synchytrium endobioticum TaxID=286115 RepID=A0A507CRP0_9FUNG|nr:hypothetical protein SeMB42_g05394 [Synchytrium endobioticum]